MHSCGGQRDLQEPCNLLKGEGLGLDQVHDVDPDGGGQGLADGDQMLLVAGGSQVEFQIFFSDYFGGTLDC